MPYFAALFCINQSLSCRHIEERKDSLLNLTCGDSCLFSPLGQASQYLLAAASDGEEVTEAQLARARAAEDALALLRAVTKRQYDQVAPSIRKMTTTLPEVWGSLLPREALAEVASWVAAGPAADTDVAEVVDEDEGAEGDVRLLPSQLHADVADALAGLEAAGVSWVDVSDDGGEDDEAT